MIGKKQATIDQVLASLGSQLPYPGTFCPDTDLYNLISQQPATMTDLAPD